MVTIVMLPMANFTRPPPTCFPSSSTRGKSSILAKPCLSTGSTRNIKAASSLNQTTISSNPSSSDVIRRSGNYEPTPWNFEFIQSLNNDYVGEKYMKRSDKLKEDIKKMMMNNVDQGTEELEKLELINNLQRLGVGYHFKEEIMQVLKCIHQRSMYRSSDNSLYATALKFRLLRQHGFNISEDIFNDFKDEKGNFKQSLCKDIEGLLQLYEASFLSIDETESTLESASRFTTSHLKNYINQYDEEDYVTVQLARHALELPLHWMLVRAEARWYINIYEKMPNANPLLLEFAKLDFNYVQAAHQQELKILSRDWWKSSSLAKKLPYARDRLIEAFFWPSGVTFDPKMNHCRRMLTKVTAMATFIDDTYDVYGTLDELELFTDAVERMEVKAMEQLPDYMKVLYLALFNVVTEIGYEVLKEQGINAIPYLQKGWADLCNCYLREARWYYSGYTPTLQEYMDNAWISVGAPVILVGAFFFTNNPITQEALESLSKYTDIIRWCTTIVRLADDLATTSDEMKRGDVPSSIQCYMNEKDVSEEEAREHIKFCIKETWNRINKAQREKSFFSETFVEAAVNMARTGQSIYQYGDGHGIQNCDIKKRYSDLYFEPIRSPIL